jgi:hypothetical protein
MARGRRSLLMLGLVCAAFGCSHAPARDTSAPCGSPSTRPTRSLTPDGYALVRGPRAAPSWVRGTSKQRRLSTLTLANGATVTVDRHTRLVQPCAGNHCYVYVGIRPKTHVAAWIFGISHWGNDPANVDSGVWDVSHDRVVMSNGLRLSRGPRLTTQPIAELRRWGAVERVSLDGQGVVRGIENMGCL